MLDITANLRQVVPISIENGWKCSMHHGYIIITYNDGKYKYNVPLIFQKLYFEYKRRGMNYTFNQKSD